MHKNFGFALAATTALCLALDHQCAQAAGPFTVLSNPFSLQTCYGHVARCIVPVYVHPLANGECSAWVDAAKIIVPQPSTVPGGTYKPQHIKIVWVIRKGEPSVKIGQYSFDAGLGVAPARGTTPTDTTRQFASEGVDGPDQEDIDPEDQTDSASINRRYRWVSNHQVTGVDGHFELNVKRTSRVGGSAVTKHCDAIDPLISNT